MGSKYVDNWGRLAVMDASAPTTVLRDLSCWMKNTEFLRELEAIDAGAVCSGTDEYIGGRMKIELNVAVMHEDGTYADSIQKDLEDIFAAKVPHPLRFRPQGDGTGKPQFTFKALLSKLPYKIGVGEDLMMSETEWKGGADYTVGVQA